MTAGKKKAKAGKMETSKTFIYIYFAYLAYLAYKIKLSI